MPEIEPDQVVMHVGGGSGYLTAVLGQLAHRVIYVDRNPVLLEAARERFFRFGMHNIDALAADASKGVKLDEPCDLVLCTTFLPSPNPLVANLREGGTLVCLEGRAGPVPSVAMYRRRGARLERVKTLGWVDFNRNAGQILIDLGLITETDLVRARAEAASRNERVLDVLRRSLNMEEIELYRSLAQQRGLAFSDSEEVLNNLNAELFRRFSRTFLDLSRMIPVREEDSTLTVVTDDPDARTDQLERLTPQHRIVCVLVTPTDFRRIWSALDLTVKGSRFVAEQNTTPKAGDEPEKGSKDLFGQDINKHISPYLVSVYEAILLDAVGEKASDIHIEQYEGRVRIRLRVDGDLHDLPQYQLSDREIRGVINVIKLRAELNIAEHRLPQGGRSRLQLGDTTYDLRIQTQPSLHGENAIIRLLPQTGRAMTIAELGMSKAVGSRYQRLLDNPAGLVLVVGPTGSGKSTTLYAGLQTLADDGRRKVITVEDPIEYSIDNIQQTRVRSEIGFSFGDAMRAFVREDPDVILVGEIRDQETALEAIRASQTGHVVLSTLHCNDAVDSLQRLYDLGIHPNSIAGELLAAAVSGNSTLTLQGGAISEVSQLLYSWNQALLQSEGPSRRALIPTPLLRGMMEGRLVRFEEIARCPQALQDAMLSVLSDRVVVIPELDGDDSLVLAREGFNLVATSNSVDEGVHAMSAALKRRMDFEEIRPIRNLSDELEVVRREVVRANRQAGIEVKPDEAVIEVLVTMFHELRNGQTLDGRSTDRLAGAALSTAEAVSVAHAASLNAWYYGDGAMTIEHLMHHVIGSALKDQPEDRRRLKHYFDTALAPRQGEHWQQAWRLRSLIQ